MSLAQQIFMVSNAFVMPFWISLVLLPRSKFTSRLFNNPRFKPMHIFALLYALMVVPAIIQSPQIFSMLAQPTLEGIQSLMSTPEGAAAGWIHYLCFDLFVGFSVWKTALERNQSFKWVSPILFLVLMFGPLGWLIYELVSILSKSAKFS